MIKKDQCWTFFKTGLDVFVGCSSMPEGVEKKWYQRLLPITRSVSFKLYLLLMVLLVVSFSGIMYYNISSFTKHLNESVINHAIQASDLIKRSTRHSMLKNDREHLYHTISAIGMEEGVEGIRIYNKPGQIAFSDNLTEVGTTVDIKAEQCIVCHDKVPPPVHLATENRFRIFTSPNGYRILGLINPIENEPACFTADCHDHSPKDKLLGLLDVKLSLKSVDEEIAKTKRQMLFFSSGVIFFTALLFAGFVVRLVHFPIRKLTREA